MTAAQHHSYHSDAEDIEDATVAYFYTIITDATGINTRNGNRKGLSFFCH